MTPDSNHFYYTFPSHPTNEGDDKKPSTPILAEVGGKALSLIETSSAAVAAGGGAKNDNEFSVPPGIVLTVAFFQPWLDEIVATSEWKDFANAAAADADATTRDQCDAIRSRCREDLALTAAQRERLDEALGEAFDVAGGVDGGADGDFGVLAVRSSSPEEDLAGTSFAGGYDTTLGVDTSDEGSLIRAIVASFSSAFDHRVVRYKMQHGMPADRPRIAVVLQRQVASDISGVGFSINPSNNCYDEVMVSANFGLGESVVGGTVTPDVYVVDRIERKIASKQVADKREAVWLGEGEGSDSGTRQGENREPTAQALSDERILEVAELAEKVEEFRGGGPVDIEWAYQGNRLYLLQARPVTAYLPLFPELLTERGEEKLLYMDIIVMSQGFSEPMSVLGLDVWKDMLMRAKPQFSVEGRDGMIWNIHGREYINLSNFMKTTGGRKIVDTVYRQYDPALGRALDSIDLDEYVPSKIPTGAKGVLWKQLVQLIKIAPSIIHGLYSGKEALVEYKAATEDFFRLCNDDDYMENESFDDVVDSMMTKFVQLASKVGGIMSAMLSRWRLSRMFAGCEGSEDLLISLCMDLDGNPTSEMGHFMVHLASFPEVQDTETSEEFLRELRAPTTFSSEFVQAYNDFMSKFGCRGMKEIDMATPRRYEQQEEFFYQLKQIDAEKNAIVTTAERRRAAYETLLGMARDMGKEKAFRHHAGIIQSLLGYREHPKYMIVVMNGMLRRRALKIGRLFVEQGRLERAEQIFDLNVEQISSAQRDAAMKILPIVRSNLAPYEAVKHVKNWPLLIDSRGKIIRQVRKEQAEDGTLLGDPISPGVVRGRAKVLNEPYEKPLKSGEILVARFTEPSWTPIFINAAGVIMEIGGPLQHGAIIAREYGIPCVSGVENATSVIKDGDEMEVDGSTGTIKFLEVTPQNGT